MTDNTQPPALAVQLIASLARHALTAGAAALATAGVLTTNDQQTQFVTVGVALAMGGASYLWSIIQKRNARKGK